MKRARHGQFLIAAMLLIILLAGCGGSGGETAAERKVARQKQQRIEQQVVALQQQVTNLDKEIADLRTDQEQHINLLVMASQQVNSELKKLEEETLGAQAGLAQAAPGAAAAANLPPERSFLDSLMRVIIAAVLLAVVFFLIKFAYGRLSDEDDDEDEELGEAGGTGEEYHNELGSIRVSPEAQAAMGGEPPADPDEKPSILD